MPYIGTDDLLVEVLGGGVLTPIGVEPTTEDESIAHGALMVEVMEGVRGPQGPQGMPGFLPPVALTDAPTIAVNAALGSMMRVTLGGNRMLGNPTNPVDSQMIMFEFTQDGVGNRLITFDTKYNFGSDLTSIQLSTQPGKVDRVLTEYVAARDEWDVIGFKKGF